VSERQQATTTSVEAICPHCHKTFEPSPLPRPTARQRGYKCPHCRLFVPIERAADSAISRDPSG
jgi:DNA-directed RNA polymerase subunit RPC12/RpoP